MLVRGKNNSNDEKDILAIGRKMFSETNPFGYKDYKETIDRTGWIKEIEYTDENGKKVNQEINALGQIFNIVSVQVKENTGGKKEIKLDDALLDSRKSKSKKEINLDDALLEDWDFDDNQQKKEHRYSQEDTPAKGIDANNLSENDFFKSDWRGSQYQLYKLLLNISSSLSDIKEVLKDETKN